MDVEKDYPLYCYVTYLGLRGEICPAELDEDGRVLRGEDGEIIPSQMAFLSSALDETYGEDVADAFWDHIYASQEFNKK